MKRIFTIMQNRKGFTLVELLVVIAIIGILAAVIAPNVFSAIEKGKVSRMIQDVETIRTAAFVFYADTGNFPNSNVTGNQNFDIWNQDSRNLFVSGNTTSSNIPDNWTGPYLDKWPDFNPFGGIYTYRFVDASEGLGWFSGSSNVNTDRGYLESIRPFEMIYIRFQEGVSSTADQITTRNKVYDYLVEQYGEERVFKFATEANLGVLIRNH